MPTTDIWPESIEGNTAVFTVKRIHSTGRWWEIWFEEVGGSVEHRCWDGCCKAGRLDEYIDGDLWLDVLNHGRCGLVTQWTYRSPNWEITAVLGRRLSRKRRLYRITKLDREVLLEDFQERLCDLQEGSEVAGGLRLVLPGGVVTLHRDRSFDLLLDNQRLVKHGPVLGANWVSRLESAVFHAINTELGFLVHQKHCSVLEGRRRNADYVCDCNVTREKR